MILSIAYFVTEILLFISLSSFKINVSQKSDITLSLANTLLYISLFASNYRKLRTLFTSGLLVTKPQSNISEKILENESLVLVKLIR